MTQSSLLALEAAQRCRDSLVDLLNNAYLDDPVADRALSMCDEIERYFDHWSVTRLHRWLGFIFGVLAARGVMTPAEQSAMMRELLIAFPEHADRNLSRRHDPGDPFWFDIGGEG